MRTPTALHSSCSVWIPEINLLVTLVACTARQESRLCYVDLSPGHVPRGPSCVSQLPRGDLQLRLEPLAELSLAHQLGRGQSFVIVCQFQNNIRDKSAVKVSSENWGTTDRRTVSAPILVPVSRTQSTTASL